MIHCSDMGSKVANHLQCDSGQGTALLCAFMAPSSHRERRAPITMIRHCNQVQHLKWSLQESVPLRGLCHAQGLDEEIEAMKGKNELSLGRAKAHVRECGMVCKMITEPSQMQVDP